MNCSPLCTVSLPKYLCIALCMKGYHRRSFSLLSNVMPYAHTLVSDSDLTSKGIHTHLHSEHSLFFSMGFGSNLVCLVPYVTRCPYSSSKTPMKCTPSSSIDLQGDFSQFVSMLHFEISHVSDSLTFSYVYCGNITNGKVCSSQLCQP